MIRSIEGGVCALWLSLLPPARPSGCVPSACELFPASVNEVNTFSDAVLCDSIRDLVAAFSPLPKMSIKSRKTDGGQRSSVRFGAEKSATTRFRRVGAVAIRRIFDRVSELVASAVECAATEFCSRPSVAALGTSENLSEIVHDLVEALSLLQTMSKAHENRMATMESAQLKSSQGGDGGQSGCRPPNPQFPL